MSEQLVKPDCPVCGQVMEAVFVGDKLVEFACVSCCRKRTHELVLKQLEENKDEV